MNQLSGRIKRILSSSEILPDAPMQKERTWLVETSL